VLTGPQGGACTLGSLRTADGPPCPAGGAGGWREMGNVTIRRIAVSFPQRSLPKVHTLGRLAIAATLVFLTITPAVAAPRKASGGAYPGLTQAAEGGWRGPFFFVYMADPQLGMMEDDRSWDQELALVRKAVREVNRLRPRFVVIGGDMTNQSAGSPKHDAQVRALQRELALVSPSIPVVYVAGNHDVGNKPTPASLAVYRAWYGDDWFEFWVGGVRFIVLNTALYGDDSAAPTDGERQRRWLETQLSAAMGPKPVHTIVLQHAPWFLTSPDEPDRYEVVPRAARLPALRLLHQAGVSAAFAGHYHKCARARDGNLEMVVSGPVGKPLGRDPSGFTVVKVYRDRVAHAYYPLEEVPLSIQLE